MEGPKKKEERAIYRGTQRLQAENVEWDNNGKAIIGANRLVIHRRNIYLIYKQVGHNKALYKIFYI